MNLPAKLNPALQPLLRAELAAGNRIAECGPSPHRAGAALVLLAREFRAQPNAMPPGVDYIEVNDAHWWKAEYVHRASGDVLAARGNDVADPGAREARS